jgi:hypothetical protein
VNVLNYLIGVQQIIYCDKIKSPLVFLPKGDFCQSGKHQAKYGDEIKKIAEKPVQSGSVKLHWYQKEVPGKKAQDVGQASKVKKQSKSKNFKQFERRKIQFMKADCIQNNPNDYCQKQIGQSQKLEKLKT